MITYDDIHMITKKFVSFLHLIIRGYEDALLNVHVRRLSAISLNARMPKNRVILDGIEIKASQTNLFRQNSLKPSRTFRVKR